MIDEPEYNFSKGLVHAFRNMAKTFEQGMRESLLRHIRGIPEPIPTELELLKGRLKYARITYKGEEGHITFVDNETGKAYRMKDDHYYHGLIEPLEEITEFVFERWCTSMDV